MSDYSKLTDVEIRAKAREIMRSALYNDELRRLLKDKLGYPYHVSIMRDSGMVAMMMWSPRGTTLSV